VQQNISNMSKDINEQENTNLQDALAQEDPATSLDQNTENMQEMDEVSKLTQELAAQKDQTLRLFADFENFRRQSAKKQLEMIQTANKELMSALLPVVDDFERAIKASEADLKIIEGFTLIQHKLLKTLELKGLVKMESSKGKEFDVETMEAITKLPAPTPEEKGKVYDEIEAGYKLGDHIIRYAKVVVAE